MIEIGSKYIFYNGIIIKVDHIKKSIGEVYYYYVHRDTDHIQYSMSIDRFNTYLKESTLKRYIDLDEELEKL